MLWGLVGVWMGASVGYVQDCGIVGAECDEGVVALKMQKWIVVAAVVVMKTWRTNWWVIGGYYVVCIFMVTLGLMDIACYVEKSIF